VLSFIPPKPKEFEKAVIGIFFEEVNGATPCNGTQPFIHDCRFNLFYMAAIKVF
jgi:hypothetical protein